MSRDFPATVDPWVMVRGRRALAGSWPLDRLARLADLLVRPEGEVRFSLRFDVHAAGMPFVEVDLEADLWLCCQRSLEPYRHAVRHRSWLGLLRDESEEAALPADYEPLVVVGETLRPVDVVEDELILAVPLVPKSGEAPVEHRDPAAGRVPEVEPAGNPFAALAALKNRDPEH